MIKISDLNRDLNQMIFLVKNVWTYFVYNYILASPRLLRIATSLFLFSILIF